MQNYLEGIKHIPKVIYMAAAIGFVAGVLWLGAVRFLTMRDDRVHYHANFAVYVNGQQEMFDSFTFYEEVQSCSGDEAANPKTRVHMHENIGHIVHVHDQAATWGHFLANLGFALGSDVIKTDDGVFVSGRDGHKLSYILNGKPVDSVANRTIGSEDVLLIDYGSTSAAQLQERYDAVKKDAGEYNHKDDPSACAGSQPLTTATKLKRAFGLE